MNILLDLRYSVIHFFIEYRCSLVCRFSLILEPRPTIRGCYMARLFIYLFIFFIFNLFIVEKFVLVTTRIAICKQQGLSQTPDGVKKIMKYWYPWYEIFEKKSLFAVLIKVNPKQKKTEKHPMQPTNNQHYIIMNW